MFPGERTTAASSSGQSPRPSAGLSHRITWVHANPWSLLEGRPKGFLLLSNTVLELSSEFGIFLCLNNKGCGRRRTSEWSHVDRSSSSPRPQMKGSKELWMKSSYSIRLQRSIVLDRPLNYRQCLTSTTQQVEREPTRRSLTVRLLGRNLTHTHLHQDISTPLVLNCNLTTNNGEVGACQRTPKCRPTTQQTR